MDARAKNLALNVLPQELLLQIFIYLPPEEIVLMFLINKSFHSLLKNDLLWKEKTNTHFCFVDNNNKKTGPRDNFFNFFLRTYMHEYQSIDQLYAKKIFSLVKENDTDRIKKWHEKENITLEMLLVLDAHELCLLDWARKKNNQALLDFFYTDIIFPHYQQKMVTLNDFDETLYEHAALAIRCGASQSLSRLLEDHENLVQHITLSGETLLSFAKKINQQSIIQSLLKHGAICDSEQENSTKTPRKKPQRRGNSLRSNFDRARSVSLIQPEALIQYRRTLTLTKKNKNMSEAHDQTAIFNSTFPQIWQHISKIDSLSIQFSEAVCKDIQSLAEIICKKLKNEMIKSEKHFSQLQKVCGWFFPLPEVTIYQEAVEKLENSETLHDLLQAIFAFLSKGSSPCMTSIIAEFNSRHQLHLNQDQWMLIVSSLLELLALRLTASQCK